MKQNLSLTTFFIEFLRDDALRFMVGSRGIKNAEQFYDAIKEFRDEIHHHESDLENYLLRWDNYGFVQEVCRGRIKKNELQQILELYWAIQYVKNLYTVPFL